MATFTQRGKKWRAQVRRNGQSYSATFDTKTAAKAWATAQEAEVQSAPIGSKANSAHTVGEALTRYMTEVSPTKRGERWEVIRLTALLNDKLAGVPFNRLSAVHLAAWRDERLKVVSPASVNRELNLLSAVLTRAKQEWHWTNHNPISEIKRPTNPPPRDRRISPAEEAAIVAALGFQGEVAIKKHEVAVAFLLALETALRRGELLSLEWSRVQLEQRWVQLDMTKNGDKRKVPLSSRAVELLRLLPRVGADCFSVSLESFDTTFRRAVRQAGIEGLHFHDTRHEALTRLAGKLSVLELARMVGHRDPRSLMIYFNATSEELADKLG